MLCQVPAEVPSGLLVALWGSEQLQGTDQYANLPVAATAVRLKWLLLLPVVILLLPAQVWRPAAVGSGKQQHRPPWQQRQQQQGPCKASMQW